MPSIFTRIIQKEIPCFKIAENDSFLAFLDINPLKEGHALVIPKKEVIIYLTLMTRPIKNFSIILRKLLRPLRKWFRVTV